MDVANKIAEVVTPRMVGIGLTERGMKMAEESKIETVENGSTRRALLKTAAQVAVTAPAVGLLLSASSKPAAAQIVSASSATQLHILDDYTYGNLEEDIDGLKNGGSNGLNGGISQDDPLPPA
jgi:hypothetical protein